MFRPQFDHKYSKKFLRSKTNVILKTVNLRAVIFLQINTVITFLLLFEDCYAAQIVNLEIAIFVLLSATADRNFLNQSVQSLDQKIYSCYHCKSF